MSRMGRERLARGGAGQGGAGQGRVGCDIDTVFSQGEVAISEMVVWWPYKFTD